MDGVTGDSEHQRSEHSGHEGGCPTHEGYDTNIYVVDN